VAETGGVPEIDSLNDPDFFDYGKDVAIVDEATQVIRGTKTVTADFKDFATKMLELEQFPELYQLQGSLRQKLVPLLSGTEKIPYHGINHQALFDN
jgi:hypothetical protein